MGKNDWCYNLTGKNKEKPMNIIATTRMSSKGQVVIPETIRKQLNLMPGAKFVVVGNDDVVILKEISAPDMEPFDTLIKQVRQQAKSAGLKRAEIAKAVSKVRGRK
jgi:AbrB family looped-hinge helix DNA binding protein